jgi:putative peptide zinc metalloprotease protein
MTDTKNAAVSLGATATPPPRLAPGVELIGEFAGSGFKERTFIARRGDGQVVHIGELFFVVAEEIDGDKSYDEIARRATQRAKLELDAELARYIVDEKLRAIGLVAEQNGAAPKRDKIDPLLALRFRAGVVPERVVHAVTTLLWPLFLPVVVVSILASLVAVDVWLFGFHGIAQSLRQTLYDPAFVLLMLGLVIVSAAFHECGHATACRYGGARPGRMGVGLYLVWPAFYTDVTDAYRLGKAGRIRTDLGGVYFNGIFILLTAGAYFATGFEPLLLMIPLQHAQILHQFLPVVRLDGYYILSDLAGVPDMFMRIGPTMKSLLPWREPDHSVRKLKPWVRVLVTAYVLTVVPLLLFVLLITVINMPRVLATTWDSGLIQFDKIRGAFEGGGVFAGAVGCIQLLVLALIPAGLLLMLGQLGGRVATRTWRVTENHPAARLGAIAAAAAAVALAGYTWLPSAVYRPIQPGEKGTLGGALKQIAAIPSGRPGLTEQRARELDDTPSKRGAANRPNSGKRAPSSGPTLRPKQRQQPRVNEPPSSESPTPPATAVPQPRLPAVPPPVVSAPSQTLPTQTVPTPVTTVTTPAVTVTAPTLPVPTTSVPTLPLPTTTLPSLP